MNTEKGLWDIFNQSGDAEEFLGFSGSEDEVVEDETNSSANESQELDSESDSDEENDLFLRRQHIQNSKKQMLSKIMEKLNENPVFCQMKTSSPISRSKGYNRINKSEYSINPYMTRKRSKLDPHKLFNEYESKPANHHLTIKLVSRKRKNSDDADDTTGERKRYRSSLSQPHVVIPVEDVSQAMLDNIAQHSVGKIYNAVKGTSCHQCRQKTMDTKSCCRYEKCVGIRGQFCGPCLLNRYGESVAESLLDPNWKCPVCRGFCNCSICRNRKGKCATGILIGLARKHGHTNVKDYLVQLGDNAADGVGSEIQENL